MKWTSVKTNGFPVKNSRIFKLLVTWNYHKSRFDGLETICQPVNPLIVIYDSHNQTINLPTGHYGKEVEESFKKARRDRMFYIDITELSLEKLGWDEEDVTPIKKGFKPS
jgi:hypothetical protein